MKKYLKILIALIVIIFVVFLAFRALGFTIYKYSPRAISMYPTISPGDICLCKMNKKYNSTELKRGMIILLKHKNYEHLLTKRIIAKENDLLEIKNNKTYINKKFIEEPYKYLSEKKNIDHDVCNIDSIIIRKDNIFVMGDNRNISLDSRSTEFGLVNINDIVGRPLIILWSKNKNKICKLL